MITSLLKGVLCSTFLICGCSTFYAQSSKAINISTSSSINAISNAPSTDAVSEAHDPVFTYLGYEACNAKALYEQVFQASFTEAEFRDKCKSTLANKQDWIAVKNYFQANSEVDLSGVEAIIAAFDTKL